MIDCPLFDLTIPNAIKICRGTPGWVETRNLKKTFGFLMNLWFVTLVVLFWGCDSFFPIGKYPLKNLVIDWEV
jgi:hypothetical protein